MATNDEAEDKTDRRWHPNPSAGLGLWGPLVPASDCRQCLMICAGLQILGGAAFIILPGRRRPYDRSVMKNRLIKLAGVLTGSYLVFTAGLELVRLHLPYDPWVEDAKLARAKNPSSSLLSLWFGPTGYKACSFTEWQKRYRERAERLLMSPEIIRLQRFHDGIHKANRETSRSILDQIDRGVFDKQVIVPELNVSDLDDSFDIDDLEFKDLNLWSRFDVLTSMNLVVLPHSIPVNQSPIDPGTNQITQHVSYARMPEMIKRF